MNDTKESLAKSQESESAKQKDLELKEKDLKDAHAKIEVLTALPSQPTQQELLSEREKSVSLTKVRPKDVVAKVPRGNCANTDVGIRPDQGIIK